VSETRSLPWLGLRERLRDFAEVYDPWLSFMTGETRWRRALVVRVAPQRGERILVVGCARGTLAAALQRAQPEAEVTVIDDDPAVLERARRRWAGAGLRFECGSVCDLDLPGTFDGVVTTLLLHHLEAEEKTALLSRAHALLRAGGRLEIGDWGRAQDVVMRGAFVLVQMLDGSRTTLDNVKGRIPDYVRRAGFASVEETSRFRTPMGTLSLYSALKG
jgi:2-polyprenyl-3-methyl-5-hydroxy-6-metoxy-1,4-benzoquinol methylase